MDRRKFYKIIAQLRERFGGSAPLLTAVAGAMRSSRAEPNFARPEFAELQPLLHHDDLLGEVYQAINAPALEAAYRATARDRRKFNSGEISAVTQLFTPKWVVEFLLQNTLGRLWIEIHPDSLLIEKWKWMVNKHQEIAGSGGTTVLPVGEIRVCDPACGTMNFGLVAMDMFRQMYREETNCAGRPGWPAEASCASNQEIDLSIVRNNLIGFDIDPMAIDLARQTLEIKIGKPLADGDHRLSVRDTLFDSLESGPFDVVVTNPPYLSARNLDAGIVQKLKKRFPAGWRDHYACFMLRCLEMLRPGGMLGILTMHSFMFTGAFERLRKEICKNADVQYVAHFGPGLFDIGNPGTLQTAAMLLRRKPTQETPATFFRLVDATDKCAALKQAIATGSHFEIKQQEMNLLPRSAWMYWISAETRRAFRDLPCLGDIAPPRQGLATTDNARFVRYWWEVEPPNFSGPRDKWKPYAKGGRFRRWYESPRHRVNWEDDGREIKQAIVDRYPYLDGQWQWVAKNSGWYGREGITYSYLTSGSFSARLMEAGTIFDVAGSSLFPEDRLAMLGVLNSGVVRQLLSAINPTVNFQVGDLRQLPVPISYPDELRREVERAVDCMRKLDSFDETSVNFERPEPWNGSESDSSTLRKTLAGAENSIDGIVRQLYGIKQKDDASAIVETAKDQLAKRWISYALGIWLGRWGKSPARNVAVLLPLDKQLQIELPKIIAEFLGEESTAEILNLVGGLERFLGKEFLSWHNLLYRGRPIFWGFSGGGKTVAVSASNASLPVMREAFRTVGQTLPTNWRRRIDDGIRINLAPLAQWISDRKLRNSLSELAKEIERGQLPFSETARDLKRVSRGACA